MFYFKDNAWFLLKNDKLVAEVLADNTLKFAPGMRAHYGENLERYIVAAASTDDAPADLNQKQIIDTALKIDDPDPVLSSPVNQLTIDQLPPFDPASGVETPGFKQFCLMNKICGDELTKLIRRCEAKNTKYRG